MNNLKSFNDLPRDAKPRDLRKLQEETQNIYKSLVIIGKKAKQIAQQEKDELQQKLAEFAPSTDNLEEVFENREQIEISTYYEKRPKPTIQATEKYENEGIPYKEDKIEE